MQEEICKREWCELRLVSVCATLLLAFVNLMVAMSQEKALVCLVCAVCRTCGSVVRRWCARLERESNLVDSASSHTLVSKIKPCMSKYKQSYL